MKRLVDQLLSLTGYLAEQLQPLARLLEVATKPGGQVYSLVSGFALYAAVAQVSDTSGWLPHQSVPFERILRESAGDMSRLTDLVSDYYEDHGLEVLDSIESQLVSYSIDDEARATMVEALGAYRLGLYRCVCRVLLPEIERVLREDLLRVEELKALKESELRTYLNKYQLTDFVLTGAPDLVLFGRLSKHVFGWVKSRAQIGRYSTPNRHAAAHGWLAYSSNKNSMNTIICTDYVFRVVTSFGKQLT